MTERAEQDTPRRAMSFGRFLFEILVVAALLTGGMYLYRNHIITREKKLSLFIEGRNVLKRNDLVSLNRAEKSLTAALDLDHDDPAAISALAELNFWKSMHGLPTLEKAKEFADEADRINAERSDRFATRAYLKIVEGKAPEAETELRALLERDIAAPKLAHALGWALMEQGRYDEANRIITQAKEADFSNIAMALTLAEMAERRGKERTAVSHLRNIVKDSMNPNHAWARGWLAALLAKNYGSLTEPAGHIQALRKRTEDAKNAPDTYAMSPRAMAMLDWAEGELALAMGNADGARTKAEEALKLAPNYPPIMTLTARADIAQKKLKEGIAAYEAAAHEGPQYRGIRWALAEAKSRNLDDGALAIVDDLEKTDVEAKGPEYEIFRGEHQLRKGNIEEAKNAFTRAAELGNDPAILFGLAKVTFEEEKKKGNKADLERVGEAFQRTIDRRSTYPEAHEYMAEISLWNYAMDAADQSYKTAEAQYKRINAPIGDLVAFYDRTIAAFGAANGPRPAKKQASELQAAWTARKQSYIETILNEG